MEQRTEQDVIPLQQCYLSVLVQISNAAGYQVLQHEEDNRTGSLWLVREGTTTPDVWLRYSFAGLSVAIQCNTRDSKRVDAEVEYRVGIDEYAAAFNRALTANRITHSPESPTRPARRARTAAAGAA